MSSAIQNRLVGTVILVALAVIFLPDILDGKKQRYQDTFVDLPPKPQIKQVEKVEPFDHEAVAKQVERQIEVVDEVALDDPKPQTEAQQAQENNEPQEQDYPVADAPSNAGWVVQLGVFRHEKNVRELLDKLKAAGYRAFSRPVLTSSGELTKVFVGPDLQKDKLEQALGHLEEVTQLKGRIAPFTVN